MHRNEFEHSPRFDVDDDGRPIIRRVPDKRRYGYEKVPEHERDIIFRFCKERGREDAFAMILRRREHQILYFRKIQSDTNIAARGGDQLRPLTVETVRRWLDELDQPTLFPESED